MLSSDSQPEKALVPIFSSPSLSCTFTNDVHPRNAADPISFTVDGSMMVSSDLHSSNDCDPILSSPSLSSTVNNVVSPQNAKVPITLTAESTLT